VNHFQAVIVAMEDGEFFTEFFGDDGALGGDLINHFEGEGLAIGLNRPASLETGQ
jgi:hypothetical protein